MATVNPRIQVTITKASHKTLRTIAKLSHRSMSSVAGELLNDVLPTLEATFGLIKELKTKTPEEMAAVKNTLQLWEDLTKQQVDDHQRRFAELSNMAGKAAAEAERDPPGSSDPPGTNRGV